MRAELVERAMRGDRDAFSAIAEQSVDRCYALAHRILRDPHRAQDATQQALFGAWRDLPSLKSADRFDAWLYRLVVHACYVEARSRRRWTARVRVMAGVRAPDADDPAGAIAENEELEIAFNTLTPERRAVVVMHHHLGYSLVEIARTLGIPVGTARSRLHYAVRQLRAALDDDSASRVRSQERST